MKILEIEHRLSDLNASMARGGPHTPLALAPGFPLSLSAFMNAEGIRDKAKAEAILEEMARRFGFLVDEPDDEDTDRVIFKWCPRAN